ncbi:hypothetical protein SDRG_16545 [Saprolegnia diclina VS20]|uniref:Uncharacterized protein n=1 Tax=Saprolegnia diclina (strain VS20) TaxID=1156394 RepID=T0PX30_SAPDV|nr:hypothetical protein SDRG_16545 [Saprolegnia diclina VS20]EQC25575.1 hypothetical protein SDRG_16545 [Saprolegnia diclina VS20]|eukprot:XP_008620982.1 hypothetical protein SDRG_16545 [Saprolegnia diclina VS20]
MLSGKTSTDNRHLSKSNWVLPTESEGHAPTSLRYMNEFVGKLQCAPNLLQMGIFPDAKEVTESMGLFNATRRFLDIDEGNPAEDGIVVVGDGSTPRTAVMFAYRTKGWTCYSVDPEMRLSTPDAPVPWEGIQQVVPIRAKIEDIRIKLRRAIVLLVHAHVTLDQALSSIEAESIVGVVTLPCCNWYGQQEVLFQRPPDIVFDDFSILSDHRELRLWVGDRSANVASVDVNPSAQAMKGCVVKTYVTPVLEARPEDAYIDKVLASSASLEAIFDVLAPATTLLQRFLLPQCRVGLLGDNAGTFASHLQSTYPTLHLDVRAVAKDDAVFDVVVDVGVLHELLFSIESRQASAFVQTVCQYASSRVDARYAHAGFISLTPRRKLKGAAYFTHASLGWQFEWFKLENHASLALCGWMRAAKDTSQDYPSIDAVSRDISTVYGTHGPLLPGAVELTGELLRLRIKHKHLTFADMKTPLGEMVQIVLNKMELVQGQYSIPQCLVRHLRAGDVVRVIGSYDASVVDAKKLNVSHVAIQALAPREDAKLYFGLPQ